MGQENAEVTGCRSIGVTPTVANPGLVTAASASTGCGHRLASPTARWGATTRFGSCRTGRSGDIAMSSPRRAQPRATIPQQPKIVRGSNIVGARNPVVFGSRGRGAARRWCLVPCDFAAWVSWSRRCSAVVFGALRLRGLGLVVAALLGGGIGARVGHRQCRHVRGAHRRRAALDSFPRGRAVVFGSCLPVFSGRVSGRCCGVGVVRAVHGCVRGFPFAGLTCAYATFLMQSGCFAGVAVTPRV